MFPESDNHPGNGKVLKKKAEGPHSEFWRKLREKQRQEPRNRGQKKIKKNLRQLWDWGGPKGLPS